MNIIRIKSVNLVASSHEDPKDPGVLKRVLVPPEVAPQGSVQMVNWAYLKPRRSFRPHYHEDMEEIFIVVTGSVRIRVGGETAVMTRGDAVRVPKREEHEMWNNGNTTAEYIVVGVSEKRGGKTVTTHG